MAVLRWVNRLAGSVRTEAGISHDRMPYGLFRYCQSCAPRVDRRHYLRIYMALVCSSAIRLADATRGAAEFSLD